MLAFFRRALSSWVVLGILGLVMIAFVVTGVNGPTGFEGGGQADGATLAKVGGTRIGSADAMRIIQNQVEALKEQDPSLTVTAFVAQGGVERTVDQMIAAAAVAEFARDQGLEASKRLIDGQIAGMPAFAGPTGKFDQATFEALLARQRIPEKLLRRDLGNELLSRMVLAPVGAASDMPASVAAAYAGLLLETRSGQIGTVPAAAFRGGATPTDRELIAFHRDNILRYTVPERRVLRYATIGQEQVAARATPTEAEIAAAYKAGGDKYASREVRTLSQVVLPSESAAKAFAVRVSGGMSFDAASWQLGYKDQDRRIGEQTRAQLAGLISPAAASAAFSATKGATVGPIKSDFGWHVIHIDAIRSEPGKTLAEARPELIAELTKQKTQDTLSGIVAAVEDAIADGQNFDDIVKANGLAVAQTPPLLPNATAPDQPAYAAPADVAPLLRDAFATGPDEDPVVTTIAENQRYALLTVPQIVPAAPRPLKDISQQVAADLIAKRAQDRARAAAQAIATKVGKGMPLAQALAQAGVPLPAPQPARARRYDIGRQGAQVPPALVTLFSMAKGTARAEAAPDGSGWLVVKLDTIDKGDLATVPGLAVQVRRELSPAAGQEYSQAFAKAAEDLVGASRDDKAVGRFKAQLSGAAAGQ
ncbi:SurA N-terminal domain-containing protein [Sphingomonas sp. ID0503]|uniref:peptidylprolyl isomerase n=1 Tax=Sphingomonas sp. ID0503 TaxID=3399691 RepID=UPI003AFA0FB7